MSMTSQEKEWIDNASIEQMLRKCRTAPLGDPFFAREAGDYFFRVMKKKGQADRAAYTAASKAIGWEV